MNNFAPSMAEFNIDINKAIHSLLYLCYKNKGTIDLYTLLKSIYHAEKDHLLKYGEPFIGDRMVALKFGPVPSVCYDLVKGNSAATNRIFSREKNNISSHVEVDMDYLSEAAIESLDYAYELCSGLSFTPQKNLSHDKAYEKTVAKSGLSSTISYVTIAQEEQMSEDMQEVLLDSIKNSK